MEIVGYEVCEAGSPLAFRQWVVHLENEKISVVFQEPRLLPWLTVEKNISIISKKYKFYIEKLNLYNFRNYYPNELSGGMQQRLSIARALSVDYDILILDEPFKGIDIVSKSDILKFIIDETKNKTVLFITHDLYEAILFSDEIKFLSGYPLKELDTLKIKIPQNERNNNIIELLKNKSEKKIKNLYL